MSTFDVVLPIILGFEGGYVHDPADHGGATNHGVTQRVYDAYRASLGQPPQSVAVIGAEDVAALYRRDYWDAVHGDALRMPLALAVFDLAVNSGVNRAIRSASCRVYGSCGIVRSGVVTPGCRCSNTRIGAGAPANTGSAKIASCFGGSR